MSDVTDPARVLRDAADYLVQHGWVQRDLYHVDPVGTPGLALDDKPAACALGAICIAVFGCAKDVEIRDFNGPVSDPQLVAVVNAAEAVALYLFGAQYVADELELGETENVPHLVTGWNDETDRTHEDVIAVLRSAAVAYERTNGGAA